MGVAYFATGGGGGVDTDAASGYCEVRDARRVQAILT